MANRHLWEELELTQVANETLEGRLAVTSRQHALEHESPSPSDSESESEPNLDDDSSNGNDSDSHSNSSSDSDDARAATDADSGAHSNVFSLTSAEELPDAPTTDDDGDMTSEDRLCGQNVPAVCGVWSKFQYIGRSLSACMILILFHYLVSFVIVF